MTQLSLKERRKQRREQEIFEAASQWISEHTYPDLNMDAIAHAANISKPTLYQHFRSKDELLVKLMMCAFQMMEQHLATLQSDSPIAQIEQIYRMLLHKKYSPHSILAAFDVSQIVALIRTHPVIAEAKARVTQHLRQLVEEGKASGEITQHLPTELIINSMFCSLSVLQAAYHDQDAAFWHEHLNLKINELAAWFIGSITPSARH